MFQQAFGFLRLAQNLGELSPQPAGPAPPRGRLVPGPQRPFLNSARVGTILDPLAPSHTASHTPPPASSTKNPWPSRLIGCASRSVHPCNDAAPAAPRTTALPRCT